MGIFGKGSNLSRSNIELRNTKQKDELNLCVTFFLFYLHRVPLSTKRVMKEAYHQGAAAAEEAAQSAAADTVRYPSTTSTTTSRTNNITTTTITTAEAATTVVAAVVGVRKSCAWKSAQAQQARTLVSAAAAAKSRAVAFMASGRH